MSDDIVARLRGTGGAAMHSTLDRVDAADEIERLTAELAAERSKSQNAEKACEFALQERNEMQVERDDLLEELKEARNKIRELERTIIMGERG